MPNYTKKAIRESFIKLLNERPLNHITVKDIVEDCGINRNSFYYHYQDLPALIEEIIAEQLKAITEQYQSVDSFEECFKAAIEFTENNRRAVMHIYNSLSRDVYEQYLMEVCEYCVTLYIDKLIDNRTISASDREIIIRSCKCEFFGIIAEWMMNKMKGDLVSEFSRLCELRRGSVEAMIARSLSNT
ncbi:MAG: TetR family transcriptional regulator [Clostridiales bacterium]|nr:TetR family transcriptional regulator [Clostridiales bacterium]